VQATPGYAICSFLSQVPGAPDPERSTDQSTIDHKRVMQECPRKRLLRLYRLALISYVVSVSAGDAAPASLSETGTVQREGNANIEDRQLKLIVETIAKKLSSVKQYTAIVQSQSLDPNGGFDRFADELTVRSPDKLRLNRRVLEAHNADMVGQKVTTVVDGTWMFTRTQYGPPGSDGSRPTYSKVNLKSVEKAGGPSLREQMAYMGNVADPFAPYRLNTLKLSKETSQVWILLAEYKQKDAPWQTNRLTIEKETGFLKKLEALIPQMDEPVVLSDVTKVSVTAEVQDSIFQMDILVGDAAHVSDYTSMWIDAVKARQSTQR
jgi:hypothetical protein